ncbi:galactolipid:galactolipid galactosyltransferase [Klebsormidium nitens]|uniref:Galactolipid:galactolipid galactosyltransferase n=1 Tax=Klebsormidium nitens TaxID=105231 RepID=A0A1Y1IBQ1_KLENI|nr:galactolipid:galactolipid galactosyltransferase [Klebsormidium nitens]|eukprot:GAQ85518.1 galactolipid:galactolipid galactosyltransferase [Klebsormidium nitens]
MAQLAARPFAVVLVLLSSLLLLVTVSKWFPASSTHSSPQLQFTVDSVDEVLADFGPLCPGPEGVAEKGCFFFGLATAPAHVEDHLNDSWLEFAQATTPGIDPQTQKPRHLNVPAWHNVPVPEQRVRFWTDAETEIALAAAAGVTVYRMGVDWGRLVPQEPVHGTQAVVDRAALAHYRALLQQVRAHGMRVLLTLFHHSMPKWAIPYGGWTNQRTSPYFVEFSTLVHTELGDLVDYYVLFNEAHVFALLTYCSGNWPPGFAPSSFRFFQCLIPVYGDFFRAVDNMIAAHRAAYDAIHALPSKKTPVIGIAHLTSVFIPWSPFDIPAAIIGRFVNTWYIPDRLHDKLDFLGINYYGQEVISGGATYIAPGVEYSDSGRAVFPDGLYQSLTAFHARYNAPGKTPLRFIVTENGVADDIDVMRPAYIVEHLLAVHAARREGVPVDGLFHWTLSDNWEWSDGYCPKFGMVAVDRANNFTRHARPSYYLFQKIAQMGKITREQRALSWQHLRAAVARNATHPFCRAVSPSGKAFAESLDVPVQRRLVDTDWRFSRIPSDAELSSYYQLSGSRKAA